MLACFLFFQRHCMQVSHHTPTCARSEEWVGSCSADSRSARLKVNSCGCFFFVCGWR